MKTGIARTLRCYANRGGCRRLAGETAIFLAFLLVSQSLWADVSASLGRQTVYQGDTVTLTIETNARNHSGEPDLAVLQKDFEVLGTSNSKQVQIINGRRTDKHQWHVELVPKNSGEVTVPAIRVGDEQTRPLQLTVKKPPAAVAADSSQSIFIKAGLEPADASAWVQQQLRYTLQLYFRESLAEGSFDGPHVENAFMERLGEDNQYSTTVNGEPYQVIERRYAIFPEQSGKLVIPAVVFDGRLAGAPLRQRSTGMSSMMERIIGRDLMRAPGKRIRLRSKEISLDVRAQPASYDGKHWLPSEQVVLGDSWEQGPPEFRAGEPVTRTITLEAKGLESSHLPDINLTAPSGMRLYPEKPEYTTRTDGEWVYGSNRQEVAYVPTAPGRITIPEVRVDWWDTRQQQQRSTVLPAWEVNVLPGEAGAATASPPPKLPVQAEAADHTAVDKVADATVENEQAPEPWLRWMLLLAGLVVIFLLLLLYRQRRQLQRVTPAPRSTTPSGKQQVREAAALLERACRDGDPQTAARALLQWAAAHWPDDAPRNLGSLAQRLVTGGQEIRELDQALYATGSQPWQGEALWQVFNKGLGEASAERVVVQEALSPLYPEWKA